MFKISPPKRDRTGLEKDIVMLRGIGIVVYIALNGISRPCFTAISVPSMVRTNMESSTELRSSFQLLAEFNIEGGAMLLFEHNFRVLVIMDVCGTTSKGLVKTRPQYLR